MTTTRDAYASRRQVTQRHLQQDLLHAVAQRARRRCGPSIHGPLLYSGAAYSWHHAHAISRLSRPRLTLGLTWPRLPRSDLDVSKAVCTAVVVDELGRVAVDERFAPWSDPLSSAMTHGGRRRLAPYTCRVFWSICERTRYVFETRIGFVHGSEALPCTNPSAF